MLLIHTEVLDPSVEDREEVLSFEMGPSQSV